MVKQSSIILEAEWKYLAEARPYRLDILGRLVTSTCNLPQWSSLSAPLSFIEES
ncbi:MAG: hypothetical protein FGF51_08145 [Candidatus Brockarchaeota archaeon]|nr:hypothetical protein [Candidatus Brockarchaeota archaeon]